jgi:hypothetical protein
MLSKDFLEENLSNKYKNGHKYFQAKGFIWFWDFLLRYTKTMKFRDWQRSHTWDNFASKMMFLNSKKSFPSLESVFIQNGLGSFPDISYFTDLRQIRDAEKIQKTVLKT